MVKKILTGDVSIDGVIPMQVKPLIIHGAGIHALEMAEIVDRINRVEPTWNLLGYLTQGAMQGQAPMGQPANGYPVLGLTQDAHRYPDCWFVPDNVRPVEIPRERLATIIDPSSFVSRTAKIGAGCVIFPHCYIGANAILGDRVFSLDGSIMNHDNQIANDVIITSGVRLAGSVTVEAGAYLGQACNVRQHTRIGAGAMVGMGAVVIRDVPAHTIVAGNPAKHLRDR